MVAARDGEIWTNQERTRGAALKCIKNKYEWLRRSRARTHRPLRSPLFMLAPSILVRARTPYRHLLHKGVSVLLVMLDVRALTSAFVAQSSHRYAAWTGDARCAR